MELLGREISLLLFFDFMSMEKSFILQRDIFEGCGLTLYRCSWRVFSSAGSAWFFFMEERVTRSDAGIMSLFLFLRGSLSESLLKLSMTFFWESLNILRDTEMF